MRTIKSGYVMLIAALLALPSVLLPCGTSAGLFAIALGIAVLTRAMIADRSEENPLYEDAAEVQNCVSEEMNKETVMVPNYLRAR